MSGTISSIICSGCGTRLDRSELLAGRCVRCQAVDDLDDDLKLPAELAACLVDVDPLELIEQPELWQAG